MKISGPHSFLLLLMSCCLTSCYQEDFSNLTSRIIDLQRSSQKVEGDSCLLYLKQAALLFPAKSEDYDSLRAENNYLLGQYYDNQGIADSATFYFHNACRYVNESIKSEREKDYFLQAFLAYQGQEKFGDCFTISDLFRSKLDEEKDYKWLSIFYFFKAQTNWRTGKYKEAAEDNEQQIKYLELAGDIQGQIPAIIFQAQIKFYYFKDRKGAFDLLDGLVKEKRLTTDFKRVIYGDYGVYMYYEGDYLQAIDYYSKSLESSKQLKNSALQKNFIATSWANIAECYLELKDYTKAQAYIDSVRTIGLSKINNDLQESILQYQLRLSYETDKNITLISKDLDDILQFRNQEYLDKIDGELLALTMANDKEKVLQSEKQASEIKYLKLQSRLILLLLIAALLAMAGIFYYRQRQYKFDKQSLQMQQRLLRSQMNPHFTFNILYAIQRLIKKDQEAAANYLLTFSRLLRLILENSMHNYVQLNKELESLNKFLELQLLRFPEKFNYEIILENMEADDLVFIPPMLLQPFVENSIDHGFSGIDYVGKVTISLAINGKYISCKIDDNGRGLATSNTSHKNSTSIRLISEYLEKATKAKVEIIDKKTIDPNRSGVIAKFLIPYNQK